MSRCNPERFKFPPPAKRPRKTKDNKSRRNKWLEMIARWVVYDTHQRVCARCHRQLKRHFLQCHHVVPLGRGGSHHPRNIILLCYRCHREVHDANL